jgi:hypothetical protein
MRNLIKILIAKIKNPIRAAARVRRKNTHRDIRATLKKCNIRNSPV